ncbi:MAG: glycosyl transferase [Candidatus Atelocyanobacterium thalassa isolate SIO64986]|uniref:Glycosyl transferase n=1 Tax=Candidatus Atelocyanobacterium thalassa isolate SIO64986 TaxID=1527444 RepID=A0A086CGC2_9CHRO|nr:MAG: glycosyl transferase [Candidatus Atelocyanobacterium thalassa isolate SIO64986]
MTELSLCMIVKNEEERLSKCLDSIKGLVDEIIVLDTGSTDKTIAVAQKFGAIVPVFEWNNDFSAARNEALKYVNKDWVLVLDADEILNKEAIPQIKESIAQKDNLVINLVRFEVGASQSPYSLVSRLFRKHSSISFFRPYHSSIDESVAKLLRIENRWKVVDLPIVSIHHYGYTPSQILSLSKHARAKEAMESFLKKYPYDSYTCSKLGALYSQAGKEKQAIKLFKQGLKFSPNNAHILFELHYHLGNIYAKTNNNEQAIKHYKKAVAQDVMDYLKLGAYNNYGVALQNIKSFKDAARVYETTLKIDPSFLTGYYNLAIVLSTMGNLTDSVIIYEKLISLNPNCAETYQNLGVVLFKLRKISKSSEAFHKAIDLYELQNKQTEASMLRDKLQEIGI